MVKREAERNLRTRLRGAKEFEKKPLRYRAEPFDSLHSLRARIPRRMRNAEDRGRVPNGADDRKGKNHLAAEEGVRHSATSMRDGYV